MQRHLLTLCFFCGSFLVAFCQKETEQRKKQPKLVIGLVIDQMRWDFLYRFQDTYGNDGFNRLLREGFSYDNTLIPYTPTETAPGHSSIFTGSVPAFHGIVGNYWYDRERKRIVYCSEDSTVQPVGTRSAAGRMSPANMWTTTIADELRLHTNFRSRSFGVSLKDRGSIFPAGHSANAAYWLDASTGDWVTSSHYMQTLPSYVKDFNSKKHPDRLLKDKWQTLLSPNLYKQSQSDDQPYEDPVPGLSTHSFPHDLSALTDGKYESFKYLPASISFSFDFAKSVVSNEKLGMGQETDFLAVSISSTDYIGHHFGPNSVEIQDAYLRLDVEVAAFLNFLDTNLGKGNYLLFLTADHGAAHVPDYLQRQRVPAGVLSVQKIMSGLNEVLLSKHNLRNAVVSVQKYQVYLNHDLIRSEGKDIDKINADVISYLEGLSFVTAAFPTRNLNEASVPVQVREQMINGYTPKRSGDVQFIPKPGYLDAAGRGTTHASWNPYDSHIPLVFFGWNVKQGRTTRTTSITDIAPTIAALLRIQMPSGSIGNVLQEIAE